MATHQTPLSEEIAEEILNLTAGEKEWTIPSYQGEMVNKGKRETESYQDTSKGLETEVSVLQRQVRELQINTRQNEDEIKNLYHNIRELRQVIKELIKRIPEDNDGIPPTTPSRTITEEDTHTSHEEEESHTPRVTQRNVKDMEVITVTRNSIRNYLT
jgi:chromosome segregation ATPase